MRRISLPITTAVFLVAVPAMAEQKALVAECTGSGARFYLSDLTISQAAVTAGTDVPSNSDGVLVVGAGKKPYWSTAGRKQIDRDCGGQGQDEIELFPGGLQPRDGTWRTTVQPTEMKGCPSMLASAIAAGSARAQTTTRRVEFPEPFDPNKLPRDFNPGHSWQAAGAHRWTSSIYSGGTNFGAEGMQATDVRLTLQLVSETEIRQSGSVKINLPKIAQQTLGISGDCRVITNSVSTWIGN